MVNNNEIWVFLSHSNKDYEKVRILRNLLEENGFRPIMLYLRSKEDPSKVKELRQLIYDEIDHRNRFILCDSENARNSDWVNEEVEYIKSKQRIYQTIDIDASIENISASILNFKKESSVFVSYARRDTEIYKQLTCLLKQDWGVRINEWEDGAGKSFCQSIQTNIDKAVADGYIIFLITENFLKSEWCRTEMQYTLNKTNGQTHNIIFLCSVKFDSIKKALPDYKYNLINFSYSENKINIDRLSLYFKLMGKEIAQRAKKGDPQAIAWQLEYADRFYKVGEHLYLRDVYTDEQSLFYERAAFANLKQAADLGHIAAQDLLENGVWSIDKAELLKYYEQRSK